jgi:hypothetical protein
MGVVVNNFDQSPNVMDYNDIKKLSTSPLKVGRDMKENVGAPDR